MKPKISPNPVHVKFHNQQNPTAEFDIVAIQDILFKEFENHSPYNHHLVEFYLLILFEKGDSIHSIDFTEHQVASGTLLTIRKDQIHKFANNPDVKGTMLLFTDAFLGSYLEELEGLKTLQLFNEFLAAPIIQLDQANFREVKSIIKRLQHEYFNVNDEYSLTIIRSELHVLITRLYRLKSSKNLKLFDRKYLSEFIQLQNLVEKNVVQHKKVKSYAQMMGLSAKTLNTVTKTIVNKSAKEFIDEICIKKIKRIILHTNLSIKEIAFKTGFEESTNFYKYFKRHTQTTPENFRAHNQ